VFAATNTWSEVVTEGSKPSSRDKLQAAVVDTCVYYFGGFGPKLTGDEDAEDEDWEDVSGLAVVSLDIFGGIKRKS